MRLAPALAALLVSTAAGVVSAAPKVVADTHSIVLGETKSVLLRVTADGTLSAAASSGTLTELQHSGDEHSFQWTPPDLRFPTTAVFAFWESDATSPEVTAFTLPLLGRTTLEMDTEPGADVRVKVGDATFGPVKANTKGRVRVPIEVPPGVHGAQVIAVAKGQQTSRAVPLEVPKSTPFAVAVGPDPLPASGGWVMVVAADEVPGKTFRIDPRGARLSDADASAGRATWALAPTVPPGATIELAVRGPGVEPRTLSLVVGARMGGEAAPSASPAIPHLLAGAFYAGGTNAGFATELGASMHFAPLPSWLSLGVEAGFRTTSLRDGSNGLGSTRSSLQAFPIGVSARARLFSRGAFALDLRAGVAALLFRHSFSSQFEPKYVESGLGFEAGGGPEVLYRVGPVELAVDLRGAWTQARTSHLIARPGGFLVTAGARYVGR